MRRAPLTAVFSLGLLASLRLLSGQTSVTDPTSVAMQPQDFQRPQVCGSCHQRQYEELRTAVKAGYRNTSPLQNALEVSANFLNGGLLRPVYSDSTRLLPDGIPLTTNMFSTPRFTAIPQVQSGFCLTCHNPYTENGANPREVPALPGVGAAFQPELIRPARDYHLVDAQGNQILPEEFGGAPPAGALPSLGASGITCDMCHNVAGPDLNRSFQHDGFANMSLLLNQSMGKVGPFSFPVTPKNGFHMASNDQSKISYLRAGAFCNACHDVRVPLGGAGPGDLQAEEHDINAGGSAVTYFRLENLSTEWQTGAYNSTNNPFGKVTRCQDCHMSLFPFAGSSTYQVGDMKITSPTPAIFPQNYAAVPGISTDQDYPLAKRQVVTHYFTGVDVPLLTGDELRAHLGSTYPDPNGPGQDEYGIPKSLDARRQALMNAAVRMNLDKTDSTATLGGTFTVRAEVVALTGHRFPAGFSQERTTYIQLEVTDDNGVLLYQSGYVVDKPHIETGETRPDGNLNDEDLEHVHAIVNPGFHAPRTADGAYVPGPATAGHTNQVFEPGPDDGPDTRVYFGMNEGLVLFRNELTHIYLPGESLGRKDASGKEITVTKPHYEETFSAAFANSVDNYRSLRPLSPRTFSYDIQLPTKQELAEMGISQIQAPLHVHAQINFEHFPPLFVRFLARTTGADGPAGHSLNLVDEQRLDRMIRNVTGITSADVMVGVQ